MESAWSVKLLDNEKGLGMSLETRVGDPHAWPPGESGGRFSAAAAAFPPPQRRPVQLVGVRRCCRPWQVVSSSVPSETQ